MICGNLKINNIKKLGTDIYNVSVPNFISRISDELPRVPVPNFTISLISDFIIEEVGFAALPEKVKEELK